MATIKKYNGSSWENAVVRKFGTATEAVENPLYSDGTAITAYTIKGNTVQSGTPTPSNPVDVNGVGVRTENILKITNTASSTNVTATITDDGNGVVINGTAEGATRLPTLSTVYLGTGTYTLTGCPKNSGISIDIRKVNSADQIARSSDTGNGAIFTIKTADTYRVCARVPQGVTVNNLTIYPMITNGSTIPTSYEPYGYKIPISNGQQTIKIYIGDLPLLKSLDGTAVDEISNGTLTRRVDSDGSVLPTPTTTQITMPSILTTEGTNSITVDTAVQPSEFTATWTGWHNTNVKEWDGLEWQ